MSELPVSVEPVQIIDIAVEKEHDETMHKLQDSFWLGPLLSGILLFWTVGNMNGWASWVSYVPLFISIAAATPAQAFYKGAIGGAALAIPLFYWMIPGAQRFTGSSIWYGVVVFLLSAILLSLCHAVTIGGFALLRKKELRRKDFVINAVLAAAMVCVAEFLFATALLIFPWFDAHTGSGLADNSYSIQPAAFFGIHILSFVAVLVNYLMAGLLVKRKFTRLYVPALIVIGWYGLGFILFNSFQPATAAKPVQVAIIVENIPPETVWNQQTGDALAEQLLQLNRSAVQLHPNLILWSESGIPWNYDKDDAFLNEVLRTTRPAQVTHILGINTAYNNKESYNSVYSILPDGHTLGRYDKQYLLGLIEKPVSGVLFPFLSGGGMAERSSAEHAGLLPTPYGKAGILICNESTVAPAAAHKTTDGAQFLLNMSNDGWFNNTYLKRAHFYKARLRAVETRRDVAINSNNGYSGLVKASGEIDQMESSTEPFVLLATVQPQSTITLATLVPHLFVWGCALYILLAIGLVFQQYLSKRPVAQT